MMKNYLNNMFDMMKETETVIKIIADKSKTKDQRNIVILSLPEEMPFRMKALITLIFPYVEIRKINNFSDETAGLPDKNFIEIMKEILLTLMRHKKENNSTDGKETDEATESANNSGDDSSEEGKADKAEAGYHSISIEEMDLSVRTYNCLKRAGIYDLEMLKKLSEKKLRAIRNLSVWCIEEIKDKLEKFSDLPKTLQLNETDYIEELNELIGLSEVKAQVKKIAAFAKMKQDLSENTFSPTFNMEFTGNPGTAKTTVARILAGIFYQTGLIRNNEMLEVGRADLVASYTGQTAVKVKEIFSKAKGGVLFIDEAYSLVENWKGEFGDEAINTIVQEMENNREDTIVIFAGYPDEMKEFFDRNPGLRSRVPFSIGFNDYSCSELIQIAEREAAKRGFSIAEESYQKLNNLCTMAARSSDTGNGRFSRNLVESAVLNYALRVYGGGEKVGKNCKLIA